MELGTEFLHMSNRNQQSMTDFAIVLDIDETLVHTFDGVEYFIQMGIFSNPDFLWLIRRIYTLTIDDVVETPGQGVETRLAGLKRDYLDHFLKFCFSYFRYVIIWSAGKYKYVHAVVDKLFRDFLPRPDIIFTYDNCQITVENYNGRPERFTEKPLQRLIDAYPDLGLSLKKMLILDDKFYTFARVNPGNGVMVPEYFPETYDKYPDLNKVAKEDVALVQFMNWLMLPEVINCPDLTQIRKDNIFQVPMRELLPSLNASKVVELSPENVYLPYYPTQSSTQNSAESSNDQQKK